MEEKIDKSQNFEEYVFSAVESVDFNNDNKLIDSLIDNIDEIEPKEISE